MLGIQQQLLLNKTGRISVPTALALETMSKIINMQMNGYKTRLVEINGKKKTEVTRSYLGITR